MGYSFKELFKQYPYVGKFQRWELDRGFGIIVSDQIQGDAFAHVKGRFGGTSERQDFQGVSCLFCVGNDPRRIDKPNRGYGALHWVLESDIEGEIDEYLKQREDYLTQANTQRIKRFLQADWYQNTWSGYRGRPQLPIDSQLQSRINVLLTTELDLKAALEVLNTIKTSPYLTKGETDEGELHTKLIRTCIFQGRADELKTQNLETLNYIRSKVPDAFNEDLDEFIGEAYKNNIVAIDIESNGTEIFQLGYAIQDTTELKTFTKSSQNLVAESISELAELTKGKWIIGHNIVKWDLPILQKFSDHSFTDSSNVWDTLYISTLLQPWKNHHALTGSKNAHQADTDAAATLELFHRQLQEIHLGPDSLASVDNLNSFTGVLEWLGEQLSGDDERFYRKEPDWLRSILNQELRPDGLAIPEASLRDLYWIPEVRFSWPGGYLKGDHRFLSHIQFKEAMEGQQIEVTPAARLLELILKDAQKRQIEVLVSMIPVWLRIKCNEIIDIIALERLSEGDIPDTDKGKIINIVTYEAMASNESSSEKYTNYLNINYPLRALAFLREEVSLESNQLAEILPLNDDFGKYHFLEPIEQNNLIKLTSKEYLAGTVGWLYFHPAWRNNQRPFKVFSNPKPVNIESLDSKKKSDESGSDSIFIRPRWIDSSSGGEIGMEGLWPTTPNRSAYWMELIGKVRSITKQDSSNAYFLLVVAEKSELAIVRDICRDLKLCSKPDIPILRQIADTSHQEKVRLGIDLISRVPDWIAAATDLRVDIHFIVEGLPLDEWLMCLKLDEEDSPHTDSSSGTVIENRQMEDEDKDSPTGFTSDHVEFCYQHFLPAWIATHFDTFLPIILDSRIILKTRFLRRLGKVQNYQLVVLNTEETKILREYNADLGSIERKPAPDNYAEYEAFLKKYWGFEGFKPDTQKPAIDSICTQKGDLLVKLPTGEGKSVIFQVPALLRGLNTQRLTIVITPLKALMRDQVTALWRKGFYTSVDYLSSDREYWESSEVYQGILDNRVKLLYVAPERFRVGRFRDVLQRRHQNDDGFEFVVIDETHCVSQWGYEFRPDYFFALEEVNRLYRSSENPVRILMFSATVTKAVEEDLQELLQQNNQQPFLVEPDAYSKPIQNFISIQPEELDTGVYGKGAEEKVISRAGEIAELIRNAKPDVNKSVVLVFVTRKQHAESLAEVLREQLDGKYNIDYFHAGLPPSERMRVYESVQISGKHGTNVLISTKAFGMGMDIPNIHWCIHLAPPSYLEDYLQEIGRTGRGPEERRAAGLDTITCTMLHHPEDFTKNHELVQRSKITPPEMIDLWDLLVDLSSETISGNRILVLPRVGVAELDANKLNLALSWLERKPTRRLSKIGFVLDMLRLELNKPALEIVAEGSDIEAQIAKSLVKLYLDDSKGKISPRAQLDDGGVWHYLRKFVGFLLHSPPQVSDDDSPEILPDKILAEVKMGSLLEESQLTRVDDLYRAIFQLQTDGSISIKRSIYFQKGSYHVNAEQLLNWVKILCNELVKNDFDGIREVPPEDLNQIMLSETEVDQESSEQKFRARVESAVRATIFLCNAAGLRIREQLNEENQLVFKYRLPKTRIGLVKWKLRRFTELIPDIRTLVDPRLDESISLGDFFNLMGTDRSLMEIEVILKLFANLSIFRSQQSLFSFSHLIELHTTDPLLSPDDPNISETDSNLFKTLDRVNRFSELRSYSMELFARLPEEDTRSSFIDEYFQANSPEELEDLLGRTVGAFEDTESIEGLGEILAKIRQKSMHEALEILENGPEPEQYQVCVHPWHKNMLVNAGPGAGKTHVLMTRTAHLIHTQGIRPEQILILAFNRAVVHEIKSRVKALFDGLGYGAYVSRLKVRTFHAFAIEQMPEQAAEAIRGDGLDNIVESFCEKCQYDEEFALSAIKGVRVILVDEFQDMNESRYQMLRSLYAAGTSKRGEGSFGIMAIGDDDQDILRWNRDDNPVEAKHYFEGFVNDYESVDTFTLKVNFRSSTEIVRRTQLFLEKLLQPISPRLKADYELSARPDAEEGDIEDSNDPSLASVRKILKSCVDQKRSCAILVHTNYEASLLHQQLLDQFPEIRLQGQQNLRVARLRHVGEWLDECNLYLDQKGDGVLTEKILDQINNPFVKRLSSALIQDEDVNIDFLVDSAYSEQPRCTLSQLMQFVEDLDINDYLRMYGSTKLEKWQEIKGDSRADLVVSTIHKIKGLEYDTVIIQPSVAEFPFAKQNGNSVSAMDQADEMRLYYVAMTRAKNELYFTAGPREQAWMKGHRATGGDRGVILQGSPDEIFLTWPGQDDTIQDYLRTSIKTNDHIQIHWNGKSAALNHGSQRIGYLSRKHKNHFSGQGSNNQPNDMDLYVSAVYRYPVTEDTPVDFLNALTPTCRNQNWFYTVMVRGHS